MPAPAAILALFLLNLTFSVPSALAAPSTAKAKELGLTSGEVTWLSEHPVIRVMSDHRWAPLEYLDGQGNRRGMTVDLLDRMADSLGVRFEFTQEKSWAEGLAALARGECDMASCVVPTPDRLCYLGFTAPYLRLSNLIYGGLQSPYIEDLRLLKGSRILVVEGFAVEEMLARDYPELALTPVIDTEAAVGLLAKGKADYFISDMASVGYYVQQDAIGSIKVVGETPYAYELSMAARLDRGPLASAINKALAAIPEPQMRSIRLAWFNEPVPRKFDWRPFAWLGSFLVLLAMAALAWIRTLSSRVKARTADLATANGLLGEEVAIRARTEAELQKALAAKELVLKELNHRIKNNLMVILGLVRLSSSEDEREHEALEETANRIEAVAKVHEQLNEAADTGDAVDLGAYLGNLADGVRKAILAGGNAILEVSAARGIMLGVKETVSLGIMVNELLTNARKYAFPGGRRGRIRLVVDLAAGSKARVTVADDGVGMDPESGGHKGSLGSTILHSLADGLKASLTVASGPGKGTSWTIELPLGPSGPQGPRQG